MSNENILPMLAKPYTERYDRMLNECVAEVKYDGLRMVLRVNKDKTIRVWSRTGKEAKLPPLLNAEMRTKLSTLPVGVYDGELVMRDVDRSRSYSVSEHANIGKTSYVIFDILENSQGEQVQTYKYARRRIALEALLLPHVDQRLVRLSQVWHIEDRKHLDEICDQIWRAEGEGVIVKNIDCGYHAGKRTDAFLKLKKWQIAVLTVTGFEASRGEINDRGPYGMIQLTDDDGNDCQVKTLDDEMLRALETAGNGCDPLQHPWIGRRMLIEYTDRTPDMKYLMPHIDRWEDE